VRRETTHLESGDKTMNTKVIGALVGVLLLAVGATSAQEPAGQEEQPQMMQRMMREMMQARRQQMMGQRDALVEEFRASTQRLDDLVAAMDSSEGDAKTDAIVAVVSELVARNDSMLELVEAQPQMMQQMHMMQMMEMMQQMMGQMTADDEAAGGGEDHQH
jgi:hypothetical protein